MEDSKLRKVYDTIVKEGYEVPDFATFETDMRDDNKLTQVRDRLVEDGYELPEFGQFKIDMFGAPQEKAWWQTEVNAPKAEASPYPVNPVEFQTQVDQEEKAIAERLPQANAKMSQRMQRGQTMQGAFNRFLEGDTYAKMGTPEYARAQMVQARHDYANMPSEARKKLLERMGGKEKLGAEFEKMNGRQPQDELELFEWRTGGYPVAPEFATEKTDANDIAKYNGYSANEINAGMGDEKAVALYTKEKLTPQLAAATEKTTEMLKERDMELQSAYYDEYRKNAGIPGYYPDDTSWGGKGRAMDKDWQMLKAAENINRETEQLVDAAVNDREFFTGFGRTVANIDTWFPVMSGLELSALQELKDVDPEKASPAQKALMEALALRASAEASYAGDISNWYKMGEGVANMVPLWFEMAFNPLSGVGKAAAKKVAKGVMKSQTKKALAESGKAAMKQWQRRVLAKGAGFLGSLAGGAGMAATTSLPKVAVGAGLNSMGKAQYDINAGGVEFDSMMPGGSYWSEFGKEFARTAIEHGTEQMGAEWLGKAIGKPLKWVGKGVSKIPGVGKGVTRTAQFLEDLGGEKYELLKNLAKDVKYDGPIEELGEEFMSALLTRPIDDDSLKQFFEKDNLLVTLGTVVTPFVSGATMAGGYNALKGNYKAGAREYNKQLAANARAAGSFGENQEEWKNIKYNLNNADTFVEEMQRVYNSPDYTNEQKKNALEYAVHTLRYMAATGSQIDLDENTQMLNGMLRESYSWAYENTIPEAVNGNVVVAADKALREAESAAKVALGLQSDTSIEDFVGSRSVDEVAMGDDAVAEALRAYYAEKALFEGMQDKMQDTRENEYTEADKSVDAVAHEDGNVYMTTLPSTGEKIFITGGKVVLDNEGYIDVNQSEKLVALMPNGKKDDIQAGNIRNKVIVENAQAQKAAKRAEIDARYKQQLNTFTYTDKADGAQHTIQLVSRGEDMARVILDGVEQDVPNNVFDEIVAETTAEASGEVKAESGEQEAENAESGDVVSPVETAQPVAQTALERVPKAENGEPVYEQADAETAWDAIMEQANDEELATQVVEGMIADKEAALKKLENSKIREGVTVAEKIAAAQQRKAAIEKAKAELAKWQEIAAVKAKRAETASAPVEEQAAPVVEQVAPVESTPVVEEAQPTAEAQPVEVVAEQPIEQVAEVAPVQETIDQTAVEVAQETRNMEPVAENVETKPVNEPESVKPRANVNTHSVIKSENEKKALRKRAEKWAKKLGVKVHVLESYDEVTDEQALKQILEGRTPGWFSNGEVYIYMPHLVNEVDLDRTVVHESVAHKGIKHFLGKEDFDKFLDGVWDMMPAGTRAHFLQYVGADMKNPSQEKMRQAADEYVAHIAEKMDLNELEKSVWQRFIDYVMDVLRKAGFKNLKQRDVEAVIRASYANLRQNSLPSVDKSTAPLGQRSSKVSQVTGQGETMASKKSRMRPRRELLNTDLTEEEKSDIQKYIQKLSREIDDSHPLLFVKNNYIYTFNTDLELYDENRQDGDGFEILYKDDLNKLTYDQKYDIQRSLKNNPQIADRIIEQFGLLRSGNILSILLSPGTNTAIPDAGVDGSTNEEAISKRTRDIGESAFDESGEVNPQDSESGIRFRKGNPTLLGTHSITEDKLRKAIKMGGLANPSTAVFELGEEIPGEYGEITFVMPSSMVDKKTGRNTGAFAGDAWTPTYPQVERQMGKRGSARAREDVQSVPKEMQKEVRMGLDSWLDGREGAGLAYLFLQEEGLAPELSRVAQRYSDEIRNRVGEIAHGEPFYRLSPGQKQEIVDLYIEQYYNGDKAYYSNYLNEKLAMMQEKLADVNAKSFIKRSIQQYIDGVNEYGFEYEAVSDFLNKVQRDIDHSGGVNDRATTQEAARVIREKGLEREFQLWKEELLDRYEIKEVIFKGFTPTGNRRYVPHTLENVSKDMKEQGRNGAVGLNASFNKFAAGLLKPLGSLDAIRKRKGNLRATHADTEAFRDKWGEVYYDLAEKLQPDAKGYEDYGLDRVAEAATEKDPKAFIKSEYGIELSEADEKALKDMVWAIQNEYPVMYFETKFERPVYLDEFAGVVIPENTGSDVVESLENAGLKIETYEPGNEKARAEAIKRLTEEDDRIMFRRANKNQEVFVSNAQRAVEGIKQEKATPEQWIAMLKKNGGLKAGEEAWLGLEEWLTEKGKVKGENGKTDPSAAGGSSPKTGAQSTVTKQEILDFIGENQIQIEEVNYTQFGYGLMDEATRKLEAELKEIGWDAMVEKYPGFDELFEVYDGELLWSEERASVGEYEDFIIDNKIVDLDSQSNAINETREKYTTEGLERKREIALTVPTIEPYNESDEVHFGDAGNGRAVAWVRFGETTDSEGNRVLVIDEIQSKRHQEGREKGYKSQADKTPATMEELTFGEYNGLTTVSLRGERFFFKSSTSKDEILDIINKRIADGQLGAANSLVPDAPFEKNWHELAMKRMLRLAAEEGFDKVAWTTGEQQAERYNIGAVLKGLKAYKTSANEYYVIPYNNGAIGEFVKEYTEQELADTFGKELAQKIITNAENATEENPYEIEGEELRVGGEGMKGFYDRMLPSFVSKYTKKWGAKVGEVTMPNLGENNTMHSVDVTPEMKESVMEGQTMFRKGYTINGEPVTEEYVKAVVIANKWKKAHKGAAWYIIIKDGERLREQLEKKGFTAEDIEDAEKFFKKGTLAAYFPTADRVLIFNTNATELEIKGYLWHENAHRAFGEIYTQEEIEALFKDIVGDKEQEIRANLADMDYEEDEQAEEFMVRMLEDMYLAHPEYIETGRFKVANGDLKYETLTEVIKPLINFINNGNRQEARREADRKLGQAGLRLIDVKTGSGNAVEVRNPKTEEQAAQETTGGLTEEVDERTLFRRAEQMGEDEVVLTENAVAALGEKLNFPARVVNDVESLPEKRKNKKGWVENGEVVVVLPNHVSMEDAMQTVLHEVVGRKGLRAVMGEEFDALLDHVYKNLPKGVKSRINYVVMTRFVTPRQATEEYIAGLAGKNSQDAVLNDIMQRMRDYFRNEMNLEVEDGELRYMLWKNEQRKQTPDVLSMVQDFVMETETNTGDNGTRFRTANDTAKDAYEKNVRGGWNKFKEGHYDRLRSVRKAQEAIAAETGMPISDSEDVYSYAEHLPSINKIMKEQFDDKFLTPFVKLLKRIYDVKLNGKKLDEKSVERYTNAKHGLERNRDMAVANALTTVEEVDGKKKPVFNKDAYEDWQTKKAAILAENITWEEKQDKLDALAKTYGAKLRDYSGLTAIFDPEGKMKYKQLRDEAIKYVTEMEGAVGKKSIDELWKIIKGMTDFSLKQSYESGLLSKDMYESILKRYEYYVPLRGFTEETAEDYYDYLAADHTPLNSVIKRAEGRKSEADNIFATILNMANSAIVFGNKNRLKQRVLNLATRNKNSLLSVDRAWYEKKGEDVWELALPVTNENMTEEQLAKVYADFEADMKRKEALGEAERQKEGLNIKTRVISDQSKAQHAIRVKRNGREYIVWVNASPTMANAVNGMLREEETGWVLDKIDTINKFRSKMVTQFSPTFVLTNLFRDVQSASTVYGIRHGAKALGEFEKNVMSNSVKMMGLYAKFKKGTLNESVPLERYFKEFLENGGETGYTEMISIEEYNKALNKLTEKLNIKNATGRALEAAGEGIEFANRCVENLCRFSAYMTSREGGMSILQSINDAKEVSVNFNRKGSGGMGAGVAKRLFMFYNPAVQALAQRYLLAKKYPKRMIPLLVGEFALGAMQPILFATISALASSAFGDDDETWEEKFNRAMGRYYNLTDYRRRGSVCLPLGDGVFNPPLAHESRVFFGLGELAMSLYNGHETYESIPAQVMDIIGQSLPLNPVEGWAQTGNLTETLALNLTPDAFKPFAENAINRDFAGNKIHNASDMNAYLPEYMRGKKSTAEIYNKISKLLSGGESGFERGFLDENAAWLVNPSKLEHLVEGYLGGAYTFAEKLVRSASWAMGNEENADVRNIPFVSSFYTPIDKYEAVPSAERTRRDWEDAFEYYQGEIKLLDGKEKAAKRGLKFDMENAAETLEAMKNGEALMIDVFNDGNKRLKELYADMDAARTAKNFDEVEAIDQGIYALKRFITERMEQMAENPAVGYTFNTNKSEGPYGERETYGDVRDVNIINEFQKALTPLFEAYKEELKTLNEDEQLALFQKNEKMVRLYNLLKRKEQFVSNNKRLVENNPEKADEYMSNIRRLRAEAIDLINNYNE